METRTIRFAESIAGTWTVQGERFSFRPGDEASVERELADKWIASGTAQPVTPPRSAEVETATRQPRGEQAIAFKRRRRR